MVGDMQAWYARITREVTEASWVTVAEEVWWKYPKGETGKSRAEQGAGETVQSAKG